MIERCIVELELLKVPPSELKNLIGSKIVYNAARWEIVRVLFRLLNHSIYKNDPNLGNFNLNYVQNSRKILDSNLFSTCNQILSSQDFHKEDTYDTLLVQTVHLIGQCLNDSPA